MEPQSTEIVTGVVVSTRVLPPGTLGATNWMVPALSTRVPVATRLLTDARTAVEPEPKVMTTSLEEKAGMFWYSRVTTVPPVAGAEMGETLVMVGSRRLFWLTQTSSVKHAALAGGLSESHFWSAVRWTAEHTSSKAQGEKKTMSNDASCCPAPVMTTFQVTGELMSGARSVTVVRLQSTPEAEHVSVCWTERTEASKMPPKTAVTSAAARCCGIWAMRTRTVGWRATLRP
mmetsp:Transcript_3776/g.8973  ORF Transcript_3776/g.8973 Transcript_3776/m.8973 type:complete len:231 (+) Transcript_3776:1021-1713(+)